MASLACTLCLCKSSMHVAPLPSPTRPFPHTLSTSCLQAFALHPLVLSARMLTYFHVFPQLVNVFCGVFRMCSACFPHVFRNISALCPQYFHMFSAEIPTCFHTCFRKCFRKCVRKCFRTWVCECFRICFRECFRNCHDLGSGAIDAKLSVFFKHVDR